MQESWQKMAPWVKAKQQYRMEEYKQEKRARGTKGKKHREWWAKHKMAKQQMRAIADAPAFLALPWRTDEVQPAPAEPEADEVEEDIPGEGEEEEAPFEEDGEVAAPGEVHHAPVDPRIHARELRAAAALARAMAASIIAGTYLFN